MQIDIFMYHCFDTKFPEFYKKDSSQLTIDEYVQFENEYEQNKSTLPYDINGINFNVTIDDQKQNTELKLTKNKDNLKIMFVESDYTSYELIKKNAFQ